MPGPNFTSLGSGLHPGPWSCETTPLAKITSKRVDGCIIEEVSLKRMEVSTGNVAKSMMEVEKIKLFNLNGIVEYIGVEFSLGYLPYSEFHLERIILSFRKSTKHLIDY
jgi:hypothetical protein